MRNICLSVSLSFRCWQKKLKMVMYIPRPSEYFKPLYHNYEGNFKVRGSKTLFIMFVVSRAAQQVLLRHTWTHLDAVLWDFPCTLSCRDSVGVTQ